MSEETAIALRRSTGPNGVFLAFWRIPFGSSGKRLMTPSSLMLRLVVVTPSSSAASAVIGLKVEPVE